MDTDRGESRNWGSREVNGDYKTTDHRLRTEGRDKGKAESRNARPRTGRRTFRRKVPTFGGAPEQLEAALGLRSAGWRDGLPLGFRLLELSQLLPPIRGLVSAACGFIKLHPAANRLLRFGHIDHAAAALPDLLWKLQGLTSGSSVTRIPLSGWPVASANRTEPRQRVASLTTLNTSTLSPAFNSCPAAESWSGK